MSARVVFGNLPREAGGSEVRELAEEAGAVRHVELLQDADTGAFNGVAVVEYQSAEIARAAIEHHDFELSGRRLWVREDREDPASQRAPQPRKYLRAFGGRGAGGRGAGYSAGSGSCRMVLGNLPYEVTWMEVKDFCREVAEPVHVAMTGNGVAVVEFHSPMDSRTAITRLHDRELHGRLVWAREDRDLPAAGRGGGFAGRGGGFAGRGGGGFGGGGPGARGNRVVIGNLPYFATWQQTKDLCRGIGEVLHVELLQDRDTGASKGVAVVEFSEPEAADRAIRHMYNTPFPGSDRLMWVREDRECSRRVVVGNLPYSADWQAVKDLCRSIGDVEFVKVLENADGSSQGIAIVEFESASVAGLAIRELADVRFPGSDRPMWVREERGGGQGVKRSREARGGGCRVIVGNLPYDVAWQQLKDHFKAAGDVVHADFFKPGTGWVEMATEQDARRAIATMNETELQGRPIWCREDRDA
eukprot:TRINITY_DN1077_c0_g1_i1.p3 TRINITY_DN1077_c0_g1~~TRINITY_DN1077_c0_g1_i1.p3  ORF type:complete len:473 (+),score=142.46 TRINITY_DN1077_c0_g1_i1:46-1464(+)